MTRHECMGLPLVIRNVGWWELFERVVVVLKGDAELLEIVYAVAAGAAARMPTSSQTA